MGHILFGLPEIEHFHLHSRAARKLTSRTHRVSVLTGDPVSFEFYCHQGLACLDLRPERLSEPDHLVPVQEFAAIDCRLWGVREPNRQLLLRASRRLERRLPGLQRLFEEDPPDLVMMYEGRTGLHRMLHWLATRHGVPVMHLGPGLLPMTLQVDSEGIDGDASFASATAQNYRRAGIDDEFLAAATGAWLGRAFPPPLARLGVAAPPLHRRIAASALSLLRREWDRGLTGIGSWQKAYEIRWPEPVPDVAWPLPPFVTLLLQDRDDPRIRLDSAGYTAPEQLIRTTWQAVRRIDPMLSLVVVTSGDTPPRAPRNDPWPGTVHFVPAAAGALAVTMAMAVVTVNHPLALAAILSGTPVLHTARSPYGIPGVATRTDGAQLADHLRAAMTHADQPTLRRRFLTRILKEHHIWCPPNAPDSNGVAGLVQWIERAIDSPKLQGRPPRYRPGPVWPLAVGTAPRRRKS